MCVLGLEGVVVLKETGVLRSDNLGGHLDVVQWTDDGYYMRSMGWNLEALEVK
jgi:hypothetical protein